MNWKCCVQCAQKPNRPTTKKYGSGEEKYNFMFFFFCHRFSWANERAHSTRYEINIGVSNETQKYSHTTPHSSSVILATTNDAFFSLFCDDNKSLGFRCHVRARQNEWRRRQHHFHVSKNEKKKKRTVGIFHLTSRIDPIVSVIAYRHTHAPNAVNQRKEFQKIFRWRTCFALISLLVLL